MFKIVLTTARATMSQYNNNIYLDFLSCLPDRLCPEWIYNTIKPPVEHYEGGTVVTLNLTLRAGEAA